MVWNIIVSEGTEDGGALGLYGPHLTDQLCSHAKIVQEIDISIRVRTVDKR